MINDNRTSSFFSRVDFEREVLRLVNQIPKTTTSLHGLAPAARNRWISDLPGNSQNLVLATLLEECWEILGGMADRSRNVFDTTPANDEKRIQLLASIRSAVNKT